MRIKLISLNLRRTLLAHPAPVEDEAGWHHHLRHAPADDRQPSADVAIVTDVCHDTTMPMVEFNIQGEFHAGKGPVLTYGPAVHNNLLKLIVDIAKANKIPFQREAASRVTGTDTDAFAYSNGGVVSALISLPLKYMHTTVETVHKDDVENVIRLIYHSLKKIKDGQDFRYLK